MGKKQKELNEGIISFIETQKLFFVATAAPTGTINISPKGMDSFRVLNNNKIIWLNVTGSGNETAAHLLQDNRMTIMFTAFEGKPNILRLYGKAKIFHERDTEFTEYISLFPPLAGARQIIELDIEAVQESCGMAVPFYDFKEERTHLNDWATKQGEEKIRQYQLEKNTVSFDGFETKLTE